MRFLHVNFKFTVRNQIVQNQLLNVCFPWPKPLKPLFDDELIKGEIILVSWFSNQKP